MFPVDRVFDVAIIGGGIGGTILASILARHQVKVVLIEGGSHPRFAIGESTVPETTFGLRVLARRYQVPEIEHLATHGGVRRNISPACGVKRNLSFAFHREGEPMRASECNQVPTFGPPLGPDSHYYRQDVDAYMAYVAVSYGAKMYTQTQVDDVRFDASGATLVTRTEGEFRVSFVVDAGGIRALLPERLGLRPSPPPFKTRSRTTFTHMIEVRPYDEVAPSRAEHMLPSPFHQGTLHHLFPGGWMWVIPFGNHINSTNPLCSVGLSLEIDRHPALEGETPEQEFWRVIKRYPSIEAQFRYARAVRPFTASRQNQVSSSHLVGDRWCLLPHASDFIDPLFSSGLAVTVCALNALSHRLISAVREQDFSIERFEYVETWVKRMFAYYDDLVSSGYTSFDNFELWNAWMRVWLTGTLYGSNAQHGAAVAFEQSGNQEDFMRLERAPYRGLQGIDNPHYAEVFAQGVRAMDDYRSGACSSQQAIDRIYTALTESQLTPDTWNVLDPGNRCPSGAFTLLPLARVLWWGLRRSPSHVRGQYFTGGYLFVMKEALEGARREISRNARTAQQFLRDMVQNWNHDTDNMAAPRDVRVAEEGSPPRARANAATAHLTSVPDMSRAAE